MVLLDKTYGRSDTSGGASSREAAAGSPQGLPPWLSRRLGGRRKPSVRRLLQPWKPKEVSFGKLHALRAKFPIGDPRLMSVGPSAIHVNVAGKCSAASEISFVARPERRQKARGCEPVPAPHAGRQPEWVYLRVPCDRRDCPECAAAKGRRFGRKLETEIKQAVSAGGSVAFTTLTVCEVALTRFKAQALLDARAELARPGRLPVGASPAIAVPPRELVERMVRRQFTRHVQLWKKRLKKAAGEQGKGLRFAYCFEYGEKRGRPHMHVAAICDPGVLVAETDLRNEWRFIPPGARARRKLRGGYRELDALFEFAEQGRWQALKSAVVHAAARFAPIGSVDVEWVGETSTDARKSARYLGKYVAKGGYARGPNDFGKSVGDRRLGFMVRDVNRKLSSASARRGTFFRDTKGKASDGTYGDFGAWVRWCQEQSPDHPLWMPRGPGYRRDEVRAAGVAAIRGRIAAVPAPSPGGEDDGLEATFDALPVSRGPPPGDECPF